MQYCFILSRKSLRFVGSAIWGRFGAFFEVFFSQFRQSYLNIYFQAKVGTELPKEFPGPLSVGKLDVGNFAFSNTAETVR